jgi:hypothetical protein
MGSRGAGVLRCAICGERIRPARAAGRFTHTARLVAACDLDGDHPALPDGAALGPVPCRTCGESAIVVGAAFAHADPVRDADHPVDPVLPAA